MTGQWKQESCGQDRWGKTAGTGQPGQDSRDRTAGTGQPGNKLEQEKERTGRPHDSKDRTAGTGQSRRKNSDKKTKTGHWGHDIWHRTTGTGPRQVGLNKSAWQVTLDMIEKTGRPGHDR